jgi:hypothetical protein
LSQAWNWLGLGAGLFMLRLLYGHGKNRMGHFHEAKFARRHYLDVVLDRSHLKKKTLFLCHETSFNHGNLSQDTKVYCLFRLIVKEREMTKIHPLPTQSNQQSHSSHLHTGADSRILSDPE